MFIKYLTKYPPHRKYSINRGYDSVVYSNNISERAWCRPGIKDQCGLNIEKERVVEDEAGMRKAEEAEAHLMAMAGINENLPRIFILLGLTCQKHEEEWDNMHVRF